MTQQTERAPGYYRARTNKHWEIIQYYEKSYWVPGSYQEHDTQDFDEIDETPINPEPQPDLIPSLIAEMEERIKQHRKEKENCDLDEGFSYKLGREQEASFILTKLKAIQENKTL